MADLTGIRDPYAPDPSEERLFDIRLVPHRSLQPRQFKILMGLFCLVGTVSSLPFVVMGAWPVAGFFGLDILVIFIAFKANYRAARAYEDVVVTPIELLLAKVNAKGMRREWRFHPAWVRIDKVEHLEFGLQRLALRSRGHSVEVGAFLGPDAKADFASRLVRALSEAKRGPRYN